MGQEILGAVIGGLFTLAGVWLTHYLQNRPKTPESKPSPATPAPGTLLPSVNIGAVILDIGILSLLTFAGGFVIGIAAGPPNSDRVRRAVIVSNILFETVGFTISGTKAGGRRWTHLVTVAIGYFFISGLVNGLQVGMSFEVLLGSILLLVLTMVVGGALSYLFNRQTR
jgi:hypothetical protein